MTEGKQCKEANPAITDSTGSRLGHWVRVAVMFLSFGFVFPHAMTEDDDMIKHGAERDASIKKQ